MAHAGEASTSRDREPTALTIRLKPGASPIAGVVVVGDEETPFVGWIELAGLIEAFHAAAAGRKPIH